MATVNAEYTMDAVKAKLYLTYTINNEGAVKVTQKMVADKSAEVSDMFRFGMQMQMLNAWIRSTITAEVRSRTIPTVTTSPTWVITDRL